MQDLSKHLLGTKGRRRVPQLILFLVLIASVGLFGKALATPSTGVSAETVRGALGKTKINKTFANGATLKLETTGAMEVIVQRVVADPGATFGWHSHPGPNVNAILQGTLTLYHARHCTEGIAYGPGSSFKTLPRHVHLARNEGTDPLVFFATYFAPRTTPEQPTRIDQPSPGEDCPQ